MPIKTNQKNSVDSVNNKTGDVVLNASDVGALPIDTKIPTKTSELENDTLVAKEEGKSLIADNEIERLAAVTNYDDTALSGRVTTIENEIPSFATQSYVTKAIANADHLLKEIVEEVPGAETAKENVIYMHKVIDATGNDKYKEYLLINGEVVCIGDTSVDLTDYATNAAVAEVEAKIPTKVSSLSDASNYETVAEATKLTPLTGRGIYINETNKGREISISNIMEEANSYPLAKFYNSGEYFALNNSDAPIGANYPLFLKTMKANNDYIYQDLHDIDGKHWYRFFKTDSWTDWTNITIPADAKFTDSGAKIEDRTISSEKTWSSAYINEMYEDAKNKTHTHENKTVIDGITSTKVSDWDAAKTHADSAHAPSNAQENVLETVKVNGTALTPSNKVVNIDLSDYAKKTDIPTTLPANGGNADMVNNHTIKSDVPENAKFTDTWRDVVDNLSSTRTDASLSANQGRILGAKLPFALGIDNDGNYGYYKAGADTVTPFKTGGKYKIISLGDVDGTTDITNTRSITGSSGNMTFHNNILIDDEEVVSIVKGGSFNCAIISQKTKYGFATATGGHTDIYNVYAEVNNNNQVLVHIIEKSTITVKPNYKYIYELTLLFVEK